MHRFHDPECQLWVWIAALYNQLIELSSQLLHPSPPPRQLCVVEQRRSAEDAFIESSVWEKLLLTDLRPGFVRGRPHPPTYPAGPVRLRARLDTALSAGDCSRWQWCTRLQMMCPVVQYALTLLWRARRSAPEDHAFKQIRGQPRCDADRVCPPPLPVHVVCVCGMSLFYN